MIRIIKEEIFLMNKEICAFIEKIKRKTVILYPYNKHSIELAKIIEKEIGIMVRYCCRKEEKSVASNILSIGDLENEILKDNIVIILSNNTESWFDDYCIIKNLGLNEKHILNYEQIKYYIEIQDSVYVEKILEKISKSELNNLKYARGYEVIQNIEKCKMVYELLEDTLSKKTYLRILCKNITQCKYYFDIMQSRQYFDESVFRLHDNESFWDVGGYDGDTIREFVKYCDGKYNSIVTFEPDEDKFRNLVLNSIKYKNIVYLNAGLCDITGMIPFQKRKFGASRIIESHVTDKEVSKIYGIKGDDMNLRPTYIKMDIEGAEKEALSGLKYTIQSFCPKLAICIYHAPEDIWKIPLIIKAMSGKYHIAIRHHSYTSSETVCYAY